MYYYSMQFPSEAVPDDAVFGPHHFWIGTILLLFALVLVADDEKMGAWWTGLVAVFCAFGFGSIWPTFPKLGATITIVLAIWLGVAIAHLRRDSRGWVLAVLGYAVLVDDLLQHAFGWPMPFDIFWNRVVSPLLFSVLELLFG